MSQKKSRFWAAAAAAAVLAGIPLPFAYAAAPITESMTLSADYAAEGTEPNVQGSGTSKHVSALYSDNASRTDPMVVDMNGHNLSLSANGDGGISSAIVVGGNQWIQIKNTSDAAKLTISAGHTDDTRASYGIFIGGNYANLTIDGAVDISNIKTEGRTGAAGINLQGGGSAGAGGSGSEVVINGPLTIKNVESGIRKTATVPNSAGIKVTADGGKVTVNGQVDITGVKGAGLYTVGADTEISVGGGIITAAEDSDKTHLYSAARVDKGTININMKDKKAGTNASQITGDFFVTREYGKKVVEYSGGELVDFNNSGAINAAIVGKDSFWKGALTYYTDHTDYGTGGFTAHDGGDFTLYLKDGASWINERQGGITTDEEVRNTWKGSKVTHFYGGDAEESRSYVEQKDTNPLTFEDYSGHTAIFYAHANNGTKAEDYVAYGDTIIGKAAKGSSITLITDRSQINTFDDAQMKSVLDALAGKLIYNAYTTGETNLTGTVQIASGLTASSIGEIKKQGGIAFDKDTGKGGLKEDTPVPPAEKTEFTTTLTGDTAADTEYAGNIKDGIYTFTKDSAVTVDDGDKTAEDIGYYPAVGGVIGKDKDITIDASGKKLSISAAVTETKYPASQSIGMNTNKTLTVTAGEVDIDASSAGSGAYGMYVNDGGTANITGNVNLQVHHTADGSAYGLYAYKDNASIIIDGNVTMKGDGEGDAAYGVSAAERGGYGSTKTYDAKGISTYGGMVNIRGNIDAAVKGTGIDARGNGTVTIAGGTILTPESGDDSFNVISAGGGTVNMGMTEDLTGANGRDVVLQGGIFATGTVNLGLGSKDSQFKGHVDNFDGTVNLFLSNGASWMNQIVSKNKDAYSTFDGSRVTKLVGGADADHAGVIIQKDSHALTFDNYSGWTKIVYAHEGSGAAVENYAAGDTVITKAAEGSGVILATDNTGIDMASKDSVEAALGALAQKITYSAYVNGEDNLAGSKVQIAEGLTSSSVTKKVSQTQTGDLGFDKDTGKGVYGGNLTPGVETPVNPPVDHDKITEGDYETFVMKGIRSAATTSFHAWRDNMTDFYDASEGADEDGIFAKAYGGKTEADVKGVHETNSYWGGQVGYDKALASGWHTGVAFDYRDGDSDYLLGGKGDDKLYSLGVYGQKTMDDGSYVKVAAKAGRVENEYTVYNELRLKALKGDYKASAYGVTAEYGKTFGTGRAYVTPKVSLAWASVGRKDYTARAGSDTISIDQESYNSLVGRLGFEAGVEHARGGFYAGLAVAHEFDGDISARYNAADGGEKHTSFDGEDTWVELVLGGRYKLSDASQLYADFARDFGGDFEHQWKLNAGIRFSF